MIDNFLIILGFFCASSNSSKMSLLLFLFIEVLDKYHYCFVSIIWVSRIINLCWSGNTGEGNTEALLIMVVLVLTLIQLYKIIYQMFHQRTQFKPIFSNIYLLFIMNVIWYLPYLLMELLIVYYLVALISDPYQCCLI